MGKRRTADFTLDLDKLFQLGDRIPEILARVGKAGLKLDDGPQKALLLAGLGVNILGDLFVSGEEDTGLELDGLDTGPAGKGMREYLLRGREFTDEEVSVAVLFVIDENPVVNGKPVQAMPGSTRVRAAMTMALDMLPQPQTIESSTYPEFRQCFDRLIRSNVLGEATTDKLGDHVWYTLCAQRRARAIVPVPTKEAKE